MKRTNQMTDEDLDLCVIGYGVKFFTPNEAKTNEGPHMIRLPYDDSIEVDRYDCRLLLHSNLAIGKSIEKDDVPDFEEDYLCEEERYLDLKNLKENDTKSDSKGTKVPYKYESSKSSSSPIADSEVPFTPPKLQYYPSGMQLPTTKKQALLIEKTAKFILEKGVEYEASLTSKMAANQNLMFLKSENELNTYYKYVVSLMKDNIYISINEEEAVEEPESDEEYLNPLLFRNKRKCSSATVAPAAKQPKVIAGPKAYAETIDSADYFAWYQRFYNGPSPYYPNILPKLIKPAPNLEKIIQNHVQLVITHGRQQEKLLMTTDPNNCMHMNFTNPYYAYYQKLLFTRGTELEQAKKKLEQEKAAIEEGELVDEAFGDKEVAAEKVQLQLERRRKAHLFLQKYLGR